MLRQKKLVIVNHCLLNQNAVVYDLARSAGSFSKVIELFLEANYGIYQLPCPETRFAGLERSKKSYDEYDVIEYKAFCKQLLTPCLKELENYKANGYSVDFCVGIAGSPTCAITGRKGHFWEVFLPKLQELYPSVKIIEVPVDYPDGEESEFIRSTRNALL